MLIRLVTALVALLLAWSTIAVAPAQAAARSEYLSLGDSLAAGFQPNLGDAPSAGYSGPVARATSTRLTSLGCTGETTATMLGGGRCRYRAGSQLAQARAFLRAHPSTSLITVSIGANDIVACVDGTKVERSCVQNQLRMVRDRLPRILRPLRAAAPHARVIVLDYYNPYLAAQVEGASRLASINSTWLQFRLNSAIGEAARVTGARVARVGSAFDSTSVRRVDLPGVGRVAVNVARICTWTWMCTRGDIHPNDTGYGVIAGAVLARLDR